MKNDVAIEIISLLLACAFLIISIEGAITGELMKSQGIRLLVLVIMCLSSVLLTVIIKQNNKRQIVPPFECDLEYREGVWEDNKCVGVIYVFGSPYLDFYVVGIMNTRALFLSIGYDDGDVDIGIEKVKGLIKDEYKKKSDV